MDEVRRGVAALADQTGRVEFRSVGGERPMSVVANAWDQKSVASAVRVLADRGRHTYFCVNPVGPTTGKGGSANDCDVLRRVWVFLDIDSRHPVGACATDGERGAAAGAAALVRDHLTGLGWPEPAEVDSGNGRYLFYPTDLPNDEASHGLVRDFTHGVASLLPAGCGASIDPSVHNAARLARVPGTWNRKGEPTPERPHRMARLLRAASGPPVTAEMIAAATPRRERTSPAPQAGGAGLQPAPPAGHLSRRRENAYALAALAGEWKAVAEAAPSTRNNTLNRAAFRLGQLIGHCDLTAEEVQGSLVEAARRCGLDEDEGGERSVIRTIQSGLAGGMKKPREMPPARGKGTEMSTENGDAGRRGDSIVGEEDAAPEPVLCWSDEVAPRKVDWLWRHRIPAGKLTTFAGTPGVGKTFLLCDIASRMSSGRPWPDDPPGTPLREPASVLFISGEDDPDDTLVPRLIWCGADRRRVAFLRFKALMRYSLADLAVLDRASEEAKGAPDGRELKLVIIDPPSSYLGDVDDHRNAELRSLLTPLKHWAAASGCSVIFNTHLNKGGAGQKVEAIYRTVGSIAWMAAVRAGHLVAQSPDDPERRLFLPLKSNLGRKPKGLSYTITSSGLAASIDGFEDEDAARIEWLGVVETTADQAVNSEKPRRPPQAVNAAAWLVERFREKLEWASDELFSRGDKDGVSKDAIFDVKKKGLLPLPSARVANGPEGKCYVWWVPPNWPHLAEQRGSE